MKLKIPFYRQNKDYTCGPASLKMVFSFFGKFNGQDNLAKILHTDEKCGTCHANLIEEVRKENFFCYVNNDSSIGEIKHFIDIGLPVVVHYKEPSADEGHYAVVSGYGESAIVLNDPWNGKNFKITEKDFVQRWHDCQNNHEYKKWILVISKNDFNLGKQYLPYSLSESKGN